jgi:uncharacterized protein YggE
VKKFIAILCFFCLANPGFTQVTTTGVGTVYAKPDCAQLVFTVTTENVEASKALKLNNQYSDSLFQIMKVRAVDEKDIATVNFQIYPFSIKKPFSYEVTHTVGVKVRDLKNIGALIDKTVTIIALVDQKEARITVSSLDFEISDSSKLQEKARAIAVADAKYKAQELTNNAEVKLGQLMLITESHHESNFVSRSMLANVSGGNDTSVMAGTRAIQVHVNMTWAIQPTNTKK